MMIKLNSIENIYSTNVIIETRAVPWILKLFSNSWKMYKHYISVVRLTDPQCFGNHLS